MSTDIKSSRAAEQHRNIKMEREKYFLSMYCCKQSYACVVFMFASIFYQNGNKKNIKKLNPHTKQQQQQQQQKQSDEQRCALVLCERTKPYVCGLYCAEHISMCVLYILYIYMYIFNNKRVTIRYVSVLKPANGTKR